MTPYSRERDRDILQTCKEITGCRIEDLVGKSKASEVYSARRASMLAVKGYYEDEISLPAIGRLFNRSHSTVHSATRGPITDWEDVVIVQFAERMERLDAIASKRVDPAKFDIEKALRSIQSTNPLYNQREHVRLLLEVVRDAIS